MVHTYYAYLLAGPESDRGRRHKYYSERWDVGAAPMGYSPIPPAVVDNFNT
jgi:hypothetical protein